MDEVKKVKNFVLPLYFCGKREVFTFTVSPRSFGKRKKHALLLLCPRKNMFLCYYVLEKNLFLCYYVLEKIYVLMYYVYDYC